MRVPSQPSNLKSRSAGFTLVELSVVLLLIALMALLVFPAVPRFTVEGLKNEARKVASFFRGTLAEGFLSRDFQKVGVDFENRKIWIMKCVPVGEGTCEWKETGKEIHVGNGVEIELVRVGTEEYSTGEIEIPVFPGGRSLPILVKLRKGENSASVFYNSFAGDVEVFEGDEDVFRYEKE